MVRHVFIKCTQIDNELVMSRDVPQYLLRDLPGEKSVKTMFSSKQIILMSAMGYVYQGPAPPAYAANGGRRCVRLLWGKGVLRPWRHRALLSGGRYRLLRPKELS